MADYPNAIYSARVMVNRPNITYDAAETKRIFAEDFNLDRNEIMAIETELGTNPSGAYESVAAYLSALAAAIGAISVPVKATGAEINTGTDDAKFATPKAIADSNIFRTEKNAQVSGLTSKTALVDGDNFLIEDSGASNAKKRALWSSIKSVLKTYFDTLYVPTAAKTYFSQFVMGQNGRASHDMIGKTTAHFGLIYIPVAITVNKITFRSGGVANGDTIDFALYSMTGATRYFNLTSPAINSSYTYYTISPSAVVIPAGYYWVAMVVNGDVATELMTLVSSMDDDTYEQSTKYVYQGTKSVTAGTLPATIAPATDITFARDSCLAVRFDN